MKPINPRPGVVVAITDKRGEIIDYDPGAFYRREKIRREKQRENERRRNNESTEGG